MRYLGGGGGGERKMCVWGVCALRLRKVSMSFIRIHDIFSISLRAENPKSRSHHVHFETLVWFVFWS